jgi:hypothetical protein
MNKNRPVCSAVDKVLSDIEQQVKESEQQKANDQHDSYLAKNLHF